MAIADVVVALREEAAKLTSVADLLDGLGSLNGTGSRPGRPKRKLHWTQRPENRQKMMRIAKTMQRGRARRRPR